jgi:hypothetical protein
MSTVFHNNTPLKIAVLNGLETQGWSVMASALCETSSGERMTTSQPVQAVALYREAVKIS